MTPETFCEQFATFAEAPNGVAKLRELILQLAVQGKLGTQDVNDEPASELIARIALELAGQQAAKRGKRTGSVSEEYSHADPHDLPLSWCWARFDQVATIASNLVSPNNFADSPHVAPDNIEKGTGNLLPCKTVAEDAVRSANHRFFSGQILYSKIRPNLSKAVIVDFDGLCSADMYPLNSHIDAGYLLRFILSSTFLGMAVRNDTRVAMPKINQEELSRILVAVPPLAEQRRIVGKVDQLLGLCDELAARQAARREARSALVGATLDRLVSARSAAEFPAHAHRLRDHFDRLFDTPTTLPQLRQAILQLAVQGQLVPQDPNDEPASVLIEQIAKFKQEAGGRATKTTLLLSDTAGVPLRQGWVAARFGDIMVNRDGERIPVSREIREGRKGPYDYYGASGVIDCIDEFLFDKPLLLIGEDGANLINRSTPIAFIAQGKYWVNNHAHVLDGISLDFLRYVELFINAIDLKPYVTGTAQPKMNQAKMNSIPIAIPPLSEQKRIVSKVTELLSLCDALEAKLTQAESASTQLLSAAVHHLLTQCS